MDRARSERYVVVAQLLAKVLPTITRARASQFYAALQAVVSEHDEVREVKGLLIQCCTTVDDRNPALP